MTLMLARLHRRFQQGLKNTNGKLSIQRQVLGLVAVAEQAVVARAASHSSPPSGPLLSVPVFGS